ncbi:YeeE/YedE family protein [Acinetobacter johnsonii]|uniref:YeeE/YedE family protein n=1 Tax=Acinetobacter johnsonii TaxID=40214 RepID=UPI003D16A7C4
MHDFLIAFIGGLMLGLSVAGYLYVNGRIAGISGLIGQVLNSKTMFKTPAIWFLSGLILTPFIYGLFVQPEMELNASPLMMIVAGLLVGFGTRLGSGCTSGHGICGISRMSKRSIVATMTFMFAGFVAVYIIRHLTGAF